MRYKNYNDYELLYLINDGNELALEYFFKKYDCLIFKTVYKEFTDSYEREDAIQECRMLLYDCMKNYNTEVGVSFFNYYKVSLLRLVNKLKHNSLYDNISKPLLFSEVPATKVLSDQTKEHSIIVEIVEREIGNDRLDRIIYEELLISNGSVRDVADKYNLDYYVLYYRYKTLISRLKILLTNYYK